ncbi:MAG: polysaccharide deacetylase family protein [bacterium]|nr:polysaccharide deacetylase family protein [bacterium]
MLGIKGLHALLGLEVQPGAAQVFIYSEHTSERLLYTCDFIFKHVVGVNFFITQDRDEFEKCAGLKINYSYREMEDCLQILPHTLLFEKGISELKPASTVRNGSLYFFENKVGFSFDVFSAVFYFISRYEEWQSFKPDAHQRFEAAESLLFQKKFHLKPLVDIWISELKGALERNFPAKKLPPREFRLLSTIDVDNVYAYRSKGPVRTLGAVAKDLLAGDFTNLKERMLVLREKKKDPFDIYEEVADFCFEHKIPLIFFFLFRTGNKHDRTLKTSSPAFKEVFDILHKNRALMGIHPSYDAAFNEELLKDELKKLGNVSSQKITCSRQHYLRFDIRSTPQLLLKNGIEADFTMGYASAPGFRAGTSYPFYYFDFHREAASTLLFVPFCAMDGAFTVYNKSEPLAAMQSFNELAQEIKKVGGNFITVFHERTFSDHLYKGFGTLYKNLHLKLKG